LKGAKICLLAFSYPADPAFSTSAEQLLAEMDVIPFDNVPPCDDCMAKAKIEGSYSGECEKHDCAMGGSLRRKRPYQQRCRDGFIVDDAEERRQLSRNGSRDGMKHISALCSVAIATLQYRTSLVQQLKSVSFDLGSV
jgi:hypothetical protein